MKIEISETEIKLVPENKDEVVALHNIRYRGIDCLQLLGKLPDEPILLLALGPDYIANARENCSDSNSFDFTCPHCHTASTVGLNVELSFEKTEIGWVDHLDPSSLSGKSPAPEP